MTKSAARTFRNTVRCLIALFLAIGAGSLNAQNTFSGTWHSQRQAEIRLTVDAEGNVAGSYHPGKGSPAEGESFNLVGFAAGDLIVFVATFGKYGSAAAWSGQLVKDAAGKDHIAAAWYLAKNYPNSQEDEHLWNGIRSGDDAFARGKSTGSTKDSFPVPSSAYTRRIDVAVDFSGRWKNNLGSIASLDIDTSTGKVTGTYGTAVGGGGPDESHNLVGFVAGDLIVFAVDYRKYESLTSWAGQHTLVLGSGEERIHTMWHLTFEVSDGTEPKDLWETIMAGKDSFHR